VKKPITYTYGESVMQEGKLLLTIKNNNKFAYTLKNAIRIDDNKKDN